MPFRLPNATTLVTAKNVTTHVNNLKRVLEMVDRLPKNVAVRVSAHLFHEDAETIIKRHLDGLDSLETLEQNAVELIDSYKSRFLALIEVAIRNKLLVYITNYQLLHEDFESALSQSPYALKSLRVIQALQNELINSIVNELQEKISNGELNVQAPLLPAYRNL